MNRTELAKRMAKELSTSQTSVRRFLEVFENTVTDALKEEKGLILQDFGVFVPWEQTAREGRNPRTGESCPILPRISVKFKPGRKLLNELNESDEVG